MFRQPHTARAPCEIIFSDKWVEILHPFKHCLLLRLPVFAHGINTSGNNLPVNDMGYQLVMDACRVLTNGGGNDDHLIKQDDETRVSDTNQYLPSGRYIYIFDARSPKDNYEVVTEFAAWRFPHSSIPLHWANLKHKESEDMEIMAAYRDVSASAMSAIVKFEDKRCVLTKYHGKMSVLS